MELTGEANGHRGSYSFSRGVHTSISKKPLTTCDFPGES